MRTMEPIAPAVLVAPPASGRSSISKDVKPPPTVSASTPATRPGGAQRHHAHVALEQLAVGRAPEGQEALVASGRARSASRSRRRNSGSGRPAARSRSMRKRRGEDRRELGRADLRRGHAGCGHASAANRHRGLCSSRASSCPRPAGVAAHREWAVSELLPALDDVPRRNRLRVRKPFVKVNEM